MLDATRTAVVLALEGVCTVAIWAIVALLALGAVERNVLGTATIGNNDDIVGYLMAALFGFGLTVALAAGGHVRVDIAYRLYGARLRSIADRAFEWSGMLAAAGLTVAAVSLSMESLERERIDYGLVDVPLWIPQMLLALGALLFMLEFLVAGHGERGAGDTTGRGDSP